MKNLLLYIFLSCLVIGFAKANAEHSELDSIAQNSGLDEIITEIEKGFVEGDVSLISPHFSSQLYLSFLNDVSGYYSSNQAYYILEKFFKEYSVISFSFDQVKTDINTPYATGIYYYEQKGNRSEAKVYLSLKYTNKSWEITQISID